MSRNRPSVPAQSGGPGLTLPPTADAIRWEAEAPQSFQRLLDEVCAEGRHQRRMDWAELGAQVFGQVCGLGTVVILALLAKHYADHGAPTQGAAIIGTGAVSIVALFITGRLIKGNGTDSDDAEKDG